MSLSWTHIVLMLASAAVVTPLVFVIPHARQSPVFNRLLVAATFVIAFLGAWLGIAQLGNLAPNITIAGIPILPIVVGALAAAAILNLILWVVDRLEHPVDEEGWDDEDDSGFLPADEPESPVQVPLDKTPPAGLPVQPNRNGHNE